MAADAKVFEFNLLQEFLSPCGPLFKLIYNLLRESYVKYEFSVTFLPVSILKMISAKSQRYLFILEKDSTVTGHIYLTSFLF